MIIIDINIIEIINKKLLTSPVFVTLFAKSIGAIIDRPKSSLPWATSSFGFRSGVNFINGKHREDYNYEEENLVWK